MSQCASTKSGVVVVESRARQMIYTVLVAACSITIGICLEWTWYATDVETSDINADYNDKYRSQIMKNFLYFGMIVSAGPAAFATSLLGFKSLLVVGMFITISGSIVINNGSFLALYIGQSLHGIGAGIVFVIVPNYAAEMAEPRLRSKYLYFIGVLIGFHYVYLLIGKLISHVANHFYDYSYVNTGIIVMAVLNLLGLLAVDDPPYYRLKFKKRVDVLDFMLKVHDLTNSDICNHVYTSLKGNYKENGVQLSLIFTEKMYWRPLLINVCLICIQQFSGLFSLSFQLQCLYETLPIISEKIPAVIATISLQFVMSIVFLLIVGVSRKKHLLLVSGFGMAVVLSLMNVAYYNDILNNDEPWLLSLFFIYIIFYSIGYGPIPWILMPEICPRNSRLWTSGVTVSLYALLNLINNQPFYENIRFVHGIDILILISTIVSIIGGSFAYKYVPETKDCIMT